MGRKGGGGGGGTPQRRPSTLSPAIINRRIDGCKINHLSPDDIADHLYSTYPDYKHYKLIPFRAKVKQILHNSRRPPKLPQNEAVDDSEDDDDDEEEQKSPERKKQKQMADEREERLLRRENDHVRRTREFSVENLSSSEESVSTSEDAVYGEDVKPEFDLMKNMLRQGYGGPKSDSKAKAKAEEKNLEVEDVRKEQRLASPSPMRRRGDGGGGKNSSEVVEERESAKGSAVEVKGKEGPRFKDLGGINNVLEELKMEVIVPLYHPQLPQWLGVKPIAGILLHGPPGCGKTRLAHAIANETGVPFYQISATDVVSGVSGASEENIRELFSKAYRTAPSILFIDEIDAIASKRENLQREMERRIVTQLLTCMDESHRLVQSGEKMSDSEVSSGYVLVIGATNRPDAVDPALRRPGRFDKEIALGVPDENARIEILSVLTQNLRLAGDFDLEKIARATPGFVGADLTALANKAGNLAMKRIVDQRKLELSNDEEWWREPWPPEEMERLRITMTDFEEAVKLVQPSLRREGFSAIPNVKWDDVGGLDVLREVFERSIVRRIKYPKFYEDVGADMDTGFLLYGPPGCGKTLIAKAVANEAGANFIHIKGPELLNKYVGESELNVRTIFTRARTCAPCILFFDEVDALTARRGQEGGGVVERLVNQFLTELGSAGDRRGVFVIGATNRPEMMDDAILRSGRFGARLYVPLPNPDQRGLILKAVARRKPIDVSVDLLALGKSPSCENLSGADLAALVHEAAMAALDERLATVDEKLESDQSVSSSSSVIINSTHFELALRKVTPSVSTKQREHYERLSKLLSSGRR